MRVSNFNIDKEMLDVAKRIKRGMDVWPVSARNVIKILVKVIDALSNELAKEKEPSVMVKKDGDV